MPNKIYSVHTYMQSNIYDDSKEDLNSYIFNAEMHEPILFEDIGDAIVHAENLFEDNCSNFTTLTRSIKINEEEHTWKLFLDDNADTEPTVAVKVLEVPIYEKGWTTPPPTKNYTTKQLSPEEHVCKELQLLYPRGKYSIEHPGYLEIKIKDLLLNASHNDAEHWSASLVAPYGESGPNENLSGYDLHFSPNSKDWTRIAECLHGIAMGIESLYKDNLLKISPQPPTPDENNKQ